MNLCVKQRRKTNPGSSSRCRTRSLTFSLSLRKKGFKTMTESSWSCALIIEHLCGGVAGVPHSHTHTHTVYTHTRTENTHTHTYTHTFCLYTYTPNTFTHTPPHVYSIPYTHQTHTPNKHILYIHAHQTHRHKQAHSKACAHY